MGAVGFLFTILGRNKERSIPPNPLAELGGSFLNPGGGDGGLHCLLTQGVGEGQGGQYT